MRIPFDIKWKPQIESGEYKVETNDHRPVRIICWDKNTGGFDRIVALVAGGSGQEKTLHYTEEGRCVASAGNRNKDLFIVTPEEELTEFEKAIKDLVLAIDEGELQELGVFEEKNLGIWAVKKAAELLSLAREQFIKDGYVIEKKVFHDAVKKVDPEVMAEVSQNMDMQIALRTEYEKGKEDALKDLPKWKIWGDGACGNGKYPIALVKNSYDGYKLTSCLGTGGEKYIMLSDLEKLPGFKEEQEMISQVSEAVDLSNFEYAMLRYVQEVANVKDDEELIELTKKYSKELLNYAGLKRNYNMKI